MMFEMKNIVLMNCIIQIYINVKIPCIHQILNKIWADCDYNTLHEFGIEELEIDFCNKKINCWNNVRYNMDCRKPLCYFLPNYHYK